MYVVGIKRFVFSLRNVWAPRWNMKLEEDWGESKVRTKHESRKQKFKRNKERSADTTSYGLERVVFNSVSKVISRLLWFCIAMLCHCQKYLAPLCQPISVKVKLRVRCTRFPALGAGDMVCRVYFRLIGRNNYSSETRCNNLFMLYMQA